MISQHLSIIIIPKDHKDNLLQPKIKNQHLQQLLEIKHFSQDNQDKLLQD